MAVEQTVVKCPRITDRSLPTDLRQWVLALPREADWDGEGAEAVTEETCRDAVDFLESAVGAGVPLPASVAPTVFGGVSLFWKQDGERLLVELRPGIGDNAVLQWIRADGTRGQEVQTREQALQLLRSVFPNG